MAQLLSDLSINEVSLVDRPANSEIDPITGQKVARARVALYKRDSETDEFVKAVEGRTQGGTTYPRSDYAYTPDDTPSHWKLRLTNSPGGSPDAGIVGAAIAALGKGFRGNKVEIPADALPGVKAKVRAAWHKANPDKGEDEMPDAIKKSEGETNMTLEQIEKKVTDQEAVLKAMQDENDVLKAENAAVLKMSKKERKAYAAMSDDQRKEYMSGDDDKKKNMMMAHAKEAKEKAAADSMDEATCKRYNEAGPVEKAAILAPFLDKLSKVKKSEVKKGGDSEGGGKQPPPQQGGDDGDGDEDDEESMALKRDLANTVDRVNKTEKELQTIKKQQRLELFSKRAESELPHTSGTPIEKGEMLMTLADTLPGGETGEAFTKVFKSLKAADSAMAVQFTEVGKHGGGNMPALKVFEAKVEEISKRDKVSVSKATETAMMESPDLYLAYEKDQRQLALSR
jgi:hypothetical protein